MLIALFADIHANRQAFSACLAHAREQGAQRIVLLGDYVGYGADPDWTVTTVMELVDQGAVAVLGNHDSAIGNPREQMNLEARIAIEWTRGELSAAQRQFLAGLPLHASRRRAALRPFRSERPAGLDLCDRHRGGRAQPRLQPGDRHVLRPRPPTRHLQHVGDREDDGVHPDRPASPCLCCKDAAGSPCSARWGNRATATRPPPTPCWIPTGASSLIAALPYDIERGRGRDPQKGPAAMARRPAVRGTINGQAAARTGRGRRWLPARGNSPPRRHGDAVARLARRHDGAA